MSKFELMSVQVQLRELFYKRKFTVLEKFSGYIQMFLFIPKEDIAAANIGLSHMIDNRDYKGA